MTAAAPVLAFVLALVVADHLRPLATRRTARCVGGRRLPMVVRSIADLRPPHSRRATPPPRPVAEWCDRLARRLRSGTSLRDALLTTVPDDEATQRLTESLRRRLHHGEPVSTAVGAVEEPGAHLHLALTIIGAAARVGGPCAPAIDRTAASLRGRAADHDDRQVQAAQARMSAHVLTAVPLLMLALLVTTDSDTRSAVTTTAGMICLTVGLSLNLLGSAWMRRMIRTAR
jgi:Flp pilus assembly protein TadB